MSCEEQSMNKSTISVPDTIQLDQSDETQYSYITAYSTDKMSRRLSGYATGGVSAYSSVADLKVHLRQKELIKEERRRLRREQLREEQSDDQGFNPIAFAVGPTERAQHHKHINLVHAPTADDISLLSSDKNLHDNQQVIEKRDNQAYLDLHQTQTRDENEKTLAINTAVTNDNERSCIDDNQNKMPKPNSNYNHSHENEQKMKIDFQSMALCKFLRKAWKKVKPLIKKCKTPIFERKEKLNLRRAKGTLC